MAKDNEIWELEISDKEVWKYLKKAEDRKLKHQAYVEDLAKALKCDKKYAKRLLGAAIKESRKLRRGQEAISSASKKETVHNMDKYTYNETTDKYIVPLKTYGANFVMTGAQHRALCNTYSTWGGKQKSLEEIGRIYNMTADMIKEYVRIFKLTRKSVPVTREELVQGNVSEVVERVYNEKKRAFMQEIEHRDWQQTQTDADKWNAMKAGELDPFERFIARYTPAPVPRIIHVDPRPANDEIFLIGLSDLHFGGLARSTELFAGQDFNAEKIKQIIDIYATKIVEEIASRTTKFKKAVICSLGDILHSLTGFTVKGVPLEADVLREEQFELALNSLVRFVTRMLEIFGTVEVFAVKGNHAGAGDFILMRTIQVYFRNEKRIKFNLFKSRQGCFRLGATAVLIDHGASDMAKSVISTTGQSKESYIQALFLQPEYSKVIDGAKCKLMLQGDRHKFMYEELRGFDHVVMGSCVVGDRYADQLGLHSRARQNCLILNKDGLKDILNFYFN